MKLKDRLKGFLKRVKTLFTNKRVRDLETLLAFEIKNRKALEFEVTDLKIQMRRLKFDVKKEVDTKIGDYEELFEASKTYGENLLNVAVVAHRKIQGKGDRNEKK